MQSRTIEQKSLIPYGCSMKGSYFEFLRDIPFFKDLTDEDIENIAGYSSDTLFKAGEILFFEGDKADNFYIVMDGEVEVWKSYGQDDADMLAVHGKGHLFGEMALIDNLPRSATVKARNDVILLQIKEEDFDRMIREKATVAFSIIRSLSAMVRKSNETFLEDLKAKNEKLEIANKNLREAQEELIRQERFSNLGKFSSMILHDLKNPISIIKAYAQMLKGDESLPERTIKYISNIHNEVERLNNLANELLDYSRGDIRLNMNIVNIDDFLSRLKTSIESRFANKNINLKFENSCKNPVLLDYERFFRVLMNLAENARKAMGKKGIFSISVTEDHSFITFIVQDNGEGMDKETMKHIFEPFYSSSKSGGTGLGMVIVKNVVEAHDGHMEVESTPGRGTKISITIPAK